jgi:uncharacterized membrane protein YgdD (TMEM256/DUF423 family)
MAPLLFQTSSLLFRLGAFSGASAVLLGAFGAHGLKRRVSDPALLKTWETAAQYHLLHSVMLIVASGHPRRLPAYLLLGGITLFSGSLYALVLTEYRALGAVTPIGGLLFVAGWLALVL